MPNEEELRAGAGFIRYEFLMLARAAQLWRDRGLAKDSKTTKWERRMVTDVFLLHARNLIDFLAPRANARRRDVLARHYSRAWACPETSVLAGRTVLVWRSQIDKLLSHVTYARTAISDGDASPRPWPIEELHEELTATLADFVSTLPASQRDWFGSELQGAGKR